MWKYIGRLYISEHLPLTLWAVPVGYLSNVSSSACFAVLGLASKICGILKYNDIEFNVLDVHIQRDLDGIEIFGAVVY